MLARDEPASEWVRVIWCTLAREVRRTKGGNAQNSVLAKGGRWSSSMVIPAPQEMTPCEKAVALLLLVGLVVWLGIAVRSMDNGFVSDDWGFLRSVAQVGSIEQLLPLLTFETDWFVRPAQWLLTWLLFRVGGLEPTLYRLTSVFLEAGCAALAGLLAYRLLFVEPRPRRQRVLVAGAVAVLFLFSWRHHEAVYWYSSVNELLCTVFRLSALYILVPAAQEVRASRGRIYSALGLYALALLSKESAVVFPI